MKKYLYLILGVALAFACSSKTESTAKDEMDHSQHATADPVQEKPKSPRTSAMAMVGGNHIHIDYSSPSVRGRQVFGGVVGFGEVWVTGAHQATSIQFDQAVMINNNEIPAGKYGFFTIPGESEWTLILNQVWDMHLADDYDPSKDVLRWKVTPQTLPESLEALTYTVQEASDDETLISMAWDRTLVSFSVKNK